MWLRFDAVRPVLEKNHFYLRDVRAVYSVGGRLLRLARATCSRSKPLKTWHLLHWLGLGKLQMAAILWIPPGSNEKYFFNLRVMRALFPWVVGTTRRRDELSLRTFVYLQ